MKLNDLTRLENWQAAMPSFDWLVTKPLNNEIKDYLQCYGLQHCAFHEKVNYLLGFREVEGFSIFQQYFQQVDSHAETVLIVHGFTDHAGLFTKVIKDLLDKGKSVLIFDLPGHGLSSGPRASIASFDIYVRVFVNCFQYFQKKLQKSFHLLAQSMGAAIVMQALLENRVEKSALGKVVLLAPLVRPAAWQKAIWSHRFLSKVVSSIPRTFSDNSEDKDFLSFVRYQDPVQHDRLSTEWVGAMIQWVKAFEALKGNNFPLWIIQGDKDQTVDWQYNIVHIKEKFPEAQFRVVEGAGHHLAGESNRLQEKIFAFIDEALLAPSI